jgi:hypothetical protein
MNHHSPDDQGGQSLNPATQDSSVSQGKIITFKGHSQPFLVTYEYCRNPSCHCKAVSVCFSELDADHHPVTEGLSFSLWIALETWTEETPRQRSPIEATLVREFLEELTPEIKDRLLAGYEWEKREARAFQEEKNRLQAALLTEEDLATSRLISYTQLVSTTGSVTQGGNACSFRFRTGEQEFLIEDLYCPNPECRCKEIHLLFLRVDPSSADKLSLDDHFVCTLSLKGKSEIVELYAGTKAEAQKVLVEWRKRYPDVLDTLSWRYSEIKKVGKRSLEHQYMGLLPPASLPEKTPRERKIGRNEPCPCGSGKKYKKCCGRG